MKLDWRLSLMEASNKDRVREDVLASRGIAVLRFSNLQMLKETKSVLERIWETCTARAQR